MKRIKRKKNARRSAPSPAPLGDCYEVHGRAMINGEIVGETDEGRINLTEFATLVHAQISPVTRPDLGTYGHAWLEVNLGRDAHGTDEVVLVLELTNGQNLMMPRDAYYRLSRPDEIYRYDLDDTARLAFEFGHWGPWEGSDACPPHQWAVEAAAAETDEERAEIILRHYEAEFGPLGDGGPH
jgi:hypothetical protein